MKILILGAGQVGRTAAYNLAREEANEVTVVDFDAKVLRDLQDRLDIRTKRRAAIAQSGPPGAPNQATSARLDGGVLRGINPTTAAASASEACSLRVVVLDSFAALRAEATSWEELREVSDVALPTVRPAHIEAWGARYAPSGRGRVFTVHTRDRWLAALPLVGTRPWGGLPECGVYRTTTGRKPAH